MWAAPTESGFRVGLTAYAVRLLGEVAHLDWSAGPGDAVASGQEIGFIEGAKATSDLYAPMAGTVDEINAAVMAAPTLLNSNLYDSGWLLSLGSGEQALLSAEQYVAYLDSAWPLAQRLLKGQAGRR